MSPLITEPEGLAGARLITLGPLTLPTIKGEITEVLGDQLETIGAGVVPGERRPRALSLTIPVRGEYVDADRYEAGLRLRRQVRALLENAPARLQGLYLAWSVDPEQNGWLLVGGGDLKHGPGGGVTFADFTLELSDCYRVANRRTHRPARRFSALDRREETTARDILGVVYSSDFAAQTAIARHFLGVNVMDVVRGALRAPATLGSAQSSRDGNLWYLDDAIDGEIVDYEHDETDMNKAIVRLYDTHGTLVEDDWEPVYGPDQPVAGVPVLDNAVCRAVPDPATGHVEVQSWDGAQWVTDATVKPEGSATALRARVVEWTTERAVVCITSTAGATRRELYLTLQRGWTGPRFELYTADEAGTATATIAVHVKTAGDATYQRSTGGATAIVSGVSIGTFAAVEPWVALVGPGTDRGIGLAVLQAAMNLRGAILSGREGLAFESPASYASVTVGLGSRLGAVPRAEDLGATNLIDARTFPEVVARG
jgi:hypothetical protein